MAPAVGIDVGALSACVAAFRGDRIVIIPDGIGKRTAPACVAFTDAGCLIGEAALDRYITDPENFVQRAKSMIGRSRAHDSEIHTLNAVDKNGKTYVEVELMGEYKDYMPEEITAMLLGRIKDIAGNTLGTPVA